MVDALRSTAHQKLTTNAAPTYDSTLIPTLDAFLGLDTCVTGEELGRMLENAWAEDPVLTLRIIWNARSILDGKGDKELFYRAFGWLFENHPRTAIVNLHCLVDPMCPRPSPKGGSKDGAKKHSSTSHGYWKDLLNILALATVNELCPAKGLNLRSNFLHNYCDAKFRPAFKNNQEQEDWSRAKRVQRLSNAHDRLTRKLFDKRYLALYVAVARLFADRLTKDFAILEKIAALPADAGEKERMKLMCVLSLAPKWAPTPGGSHDRVTNISSAICLLLHHEHVSSSVAHKIEFSPTQTLPAREMHLLRWFYQRHVLTPGRRYTGVPEPLMSANRWSEIAYSRVPSICMHANKEKFFTKDPERFLSYLTDVESGKKQISGATLLPHLLVMQAAKIIISQKEPLMWDVLKKRKVNSIGNVMRERRRELAQTQARVVDAQWATLLARLREAGELDNCIAVCDVSGSMGSFWEPSLLGKSPFEVAPLWPALSLSLILARLAKPPFADSFITFSSRPRVVVLDPESKKVSLGTTIQAMMRPDWEMNTDLNAVFMQLILPLAIKNRVPKEEMIKRVFVFSDMQFDCAQSTRPNPANWKTNHDLVERAYQRLGYDVPEIVYWNLSRESITAPVTGEREGVALVNGYSPSLLKVFMDVEEEEDSKVLDNLGEKVKQEFTPEEIMRKALGRRSYDGLVVVD
ncbi:hypothetical protein PAXRUDRAFT_32596 [Paxillus rubicundulus Ve08.2h10]|uniref:Uncharacterized protein n=1 Tax=Paxillus rubicundulus Ve08.2h10 TaxID=930991 RepID=A0A0D0E4H6_9AGAM|nr:hypothetical protein PAXRUDRAFT_32596 [Paxillus rubicundulus Ve08.2h10]